MLRWPIRVGIMVLTGVSLNQPAFAMIDPDSSRVTVTYTRPGPPVRYLTISPGAHGETLASIGITITVTLKNALGQPQIGEPAEAVVLYNPALCLCPGGNIADAPTDRDGQTMITGTVRGGGCASFLRVFAAGVPIGPVLAIGINSTDIGQVSPCFVDAGDLADLTTRLGVPSNYTICSDFNEDGVIDAGDIAYFAAHLGAACEGP